MTAKSAQNRVLVTLLATGMSQCAAAEAAGVSESTVTRRMATPEFREKVETARHELTTQAAGQLLSAVPKAISTLSSLAETAASEGIRLNAAKAVLEMTIKWREHGDLLEKLVELQKLVEQRPA